MPREDVEEARRLWSVLCWSPVSFLTTHDSYESGLYHGIIEPSVLRDSVLVLRALLGGLVRSALGVVRSAHPVSLPSLGRVGRYVLVIGVGSAKYAFEEREIREAAAQRGFGVVTLHGRSASCGPKEHEVVDMEAVLTGGDWADASCLWLRQAWRAVWSFRRREERERSLLAASIGAIRQRYVWERFTERLIQAYGRPKMVISLCPGSSMSRTVVDRMRRYGVVTGGVRTQATSTSLENLAINVDILFCKSAGERAGYAELFGDESPRLEEGCILSLPEIYEMEPLALPEGYCLLLGTAPVARESEGAFAAYLDRLFQVAAVVGRPVVFKSHNLGIARDDEWFEMRARNCETVVRVRDIRRNRELIDRAAIVVSAPSTLLYYAILKEKPVIIVETEQAAALPDEFRGAPLARIAWTRDVDDWKNERDRGSCSADAALSWFRAKYGLDRGAPFIVDYLAREARSAS